MKRNFLIFLIALLCAVSIAKAEGLCARNEDVVFNCELEKSIASLCITHDGGEFVYRKGNAQKIELELKGGKGNDSRFRFSYVPYSGGGEAHIHFVVHSYAYFLYDKTANEDGGVDSSAGILVFRNAKRIASLSCKNDASIRSSAYNEMKNEDYKDIGVR